VHWDLFGNPNGFSSRFIGVFGLPVIITLTALLLTILPRFDRMARNMTNAPDIYRILVLAVVCMLTGLQVFSLLAAMGSDIPIVLVIPVLIGFLFIVIGGLTPHIGRNRTMGFRYPWTLRDDRVWKKTHEHGGPVMVYAGILMVILSPFAGIYGIPLMLVIIFAAILYVTVYSYRVAQASRSG
jgi:uncharacterized membrane protein